MKARLGKCLRSFTDGCKCNTLSCVLNPRAKMSVVAVFLISFCGIAQPPAFAHGELVSATPAKDSIISQLPKTASIEFDGALITLGGPKTNVLRVQDPQGVQIDLGDSMVSGGTLMVSLKSVSIPGKYHLSYRIVSEDGHPVQGAYDFSLSPSSATPVPSAISSVQPKQDSDSNIHKSQQLTGTTKFSLSAALIASVLIWWAAARRRKNLD